MQRSRILGVLGSSILLLQGLLFFILPVTTQSVFASPDETAVMVAARAYAETGSMRLVDPLLTSFPWLHPRSFVTQGDALVPVGFLGWPMILSLVARVTSVALPFVTPLLVISVAYPLFCFSRRFGRLGQWVAISLWLSFPSVILYANRALFPNLPVVCLAVWAAYLVWSQRSNRAMVGAGILAGMACIIRPLELVWIVPWLWLAYAGRSFSDVIPSESASRGIASKGFLRSSLSLLGRNDRRTILAFFLFGFAAPLVWSLFVAWQTYGSPWIVGYFLHDPIISFVASSPSIAPATSVIRWPFGFHPRAVWFNAKNYLLVFLWPWALVVLTALSLYIRRRAARSILIVALWTVGMLALLYGQAIYQDHVGVNIVSLGNSYLRYLLPVTVFIALGGAALAHESVRRLPRAGFTSAIIICLALSIGGMHLALAHPTEGVFAVRHELQRYETIRAKTLALTNPEDLILSERSDKIFFPLRRVASPLPDYERMYDLVMQASQNVFVFSETLDANRLKQFNEERLTLRSLMTNRNQTLYAVEAMTTNP